MIVALKDMGTWPGCMRHAIEAYLVLQNLRLLQLKNYMGTKLGCRRWQLGKSISKRE